MPSIGWTPSYNVSSIFPSAVIADPDYLRSPAKKAPSRKSRRAAAEPRKMSEIHDGFLSRALDKAVEAMPSVQFRAFHWTDPGVAVIRADISIPMAEISALRSVYRTNGIVAYRGILLPKLFGYRGYLFSVAENLLDNEQGFVPLICTELRSARTNRPIRSAPRIIQHFKGLEEKGWKLSGRAEFTRQNWPSKKLSPAARNSVRVVTHSHAERMREH